MYVKATISPVGTATYLSSSSYIFSFPLGKNEDAGLNSKIWTCSHKDQTIWHWRGLFWRQQSRQPSHYWMSEIKKTFSAFLNLSI